MSSSSRSPRWESSRSVCERVLNPRGTREARDPLSVTREARDPLSVTRTESVKRASMRVKASFPISSPRSRRNRWIAT